MGTPMAPPKRSNPMTTFNLGTHNTSFRHRTFANDLYPADGGARNCHDTELENGRLSSTDCRLVQVARAINFFFAFALAHCDGVNCRISVLFALDRHRQRPGLRPPLAGWRHPRVGCEVGGANSSIISGSERSAWLSC